MALAEGLKDPIAACKLFYEALVTESRACLLFPPGLFLLLLTFAFALSLTFKKGKRSALSTTFKS